MVYPDSEEDDKTSITSPNEISSLVDQMAVPSDKDRALAALAAELGADDGTQEIQNPMALWQDAKAALDRAKEAAEAEEEEEEFSATEVLDPASLSFAMPGQGAAPQAPAPQPQAPAPQQAAPQAPAYQQPAQPQAPPRPQIPQPPQQPQRMEPAAFSQQYAPDTPPAGRHTSGEWPSPPSPQQVAPPQQQAPAQVPVGQAAHNGSGLNAPPSQHGFQRSPSGLTSAALFEDSEANASAGPPPQTFGQDQGFGAPPAQAAPQMPAAPAAPDTGAPADHPGPWKLKTNFGLTYEFPDTRGLRSWLSSREELDGYTVSADDGGSFHDLSAFPQLDRGASRRMSSPGGGSGMQPASSGMYQNPMGSGQQPYGTPPAPDAFGSGLNQAPPAAFGGPQQQPQQPQQPRGPKVSNEFRPPSRESKSKGLLWLVFLLLALVFVFVALETFGIFKVTELISGPKVEQTLPTPTDPTTAVAEKAPDLDPEEEAKRQAAEVERFLKDVQRKIDGNKLPAALDVLATAEQIAPEDARIHELKAVVYDKLGQPEEAEASRKKVEEIKAAAEPEGAPEEGAEEEEPAPEDTE